MSPDMRVEVAIRRGEQLVEVSEFAEALKEYQRALDTQKNSSMAHYRVAEVFFLQQNYQSAANEFREAINGDLNPKWIEVWSHIYLGKIFDISGQRERAVNEYTQAQRTRDNTAGRAGSGAEVFERTIQDHKAKRGSEATPLLYKCSWHFPNRRKRFRNMIVPGEVLLIGDGPQQTQAPGAETQPCGHKPQSSAASNPAEIHRM